MGFCWRSLETAEAPPVADEARWSRGSVPVSMPQRGWKPADTTVQASAHTGNLSPTVEQQISSTGRVAAALIEVSPFPASTNFRRQLLYTTKEVLKPKVSSGVFCILFVAADKKYAAGGRSQKLLCKKGVLRPPVSGLPFSLHTTSYQCSSFL